MSTPRSSGMTPCLSMWVELQFTVGFFIKVVVQVSPRGCGDAALMSALGRVRSVLRSEGHPHGVYPVFGMDYGVLLEVPTTRDSSPDFSDQIDPSVEQALVFYGNASRPLDDGGYRFEVDLWSWPLPPPRALTMTLDWPVVGVENVALRVDGAAIVSAAV